MGIRVCKKCGNKAFTIQTIPCCSECSENGAYDGDTKIYDEKIIAEKRLSREEVYEEGTCRMGDSAFGAGCHIYRCANCQTLHDHMPMSDSC